MPKSKATKQAEAEERKAAHAARTPSEQMRLVIARPGENRRERMKLMAQIESGKPRVGK